MKRLSAQVLTGLVLAAALAAGCTAATAPPAVSVGDTAARAEPLLAQATPIKSTAEGVTVTGLGRVLGAPDTLRATVGVEVTAASVQEAMDGAEAASQQVLDALAAQGVAPEDIQTAELRVDPRYEQPDPDTPAVITGYIVSNLLDVTVRDLDTAGDVIEAAVAAGGDSARLQNVQFTLEDNADLLDAARERAFADAYAKAEQYAELSGHELGALLSLSEGSASQPQATEYIAEGDEAAARQLAVAPGQEETSVQLSATWSLDG